MNGNEILMLWSDARRVKYDKIQLGLSSIKKEVWSGVFSCQESAGNQRFPANPNFKNTLIFVLHL
ncbi:MULTISPECIES: hypothetical protein [Bacillus]|uniref:Uncharacterized protein n=1 Tax=Bacillus glycinifermentans TaxID=1664069 RepID=A0AAJ3YYJ1_9BACI|nr:MULTISPECIES: hypothetical protein [Bacillus]KKB75037.1 hypothetical protein TH62_04350 [Bacillus sp. TH008]MBU8784908.1 hypothetical protein [Bacillus glycinifermentans]MDU0071012.1 hypothetical protein [Bacillus sp. IG6]MED8018880.1 hypothetical protein [Bacillus glycinifermentans]NUJ15083.1 hypothetical protein [Bacillus glycinifermentans]